jgi:hypothetical protein
MRPKILKHRGTGGNGGFFSEIPNEVRERYSLEMLSASYLATEKVNAKGPLAALETTEKANLLLPLFLWVSRVFFQNCSKEPITRMRAGNGSQKISTNEFINVAPHEFAGAL